MPFGPNFDQQARITLLTWTAFCNLIELLELDTANFSENAAPAARVRTFRNESNAAEISEAAIEMAIITTVTRPTAEKIIAVLEIPVPDGLYVGSPPWFSAVRAQLESRGITPPQIKAARAQGLGSASPVDQPGPSHGWEAPSSEHLEQIMDKRSTLLPMDFLEKAVRASRAVAKVVVPVDGNKAYGTGFVIANNLLVTNAHVLKDKTQAAAAEVLFNFQRTVDGVDREPDRVTLDPGLYFRSSASDVDDLTVVALKEAPAGRWLELALKEEKGKRLKKDDAVCIIQHPGGEQKQIGMHHNVVTYTDDRLLQYLTDTLPGSSGSPVFDRDWDVVGVHHAGGWLREPASKRTLFRNEGIRLDRLLALMK
ncbi:trypsin-like peptidase [Roseimicrobium gellanilyticum]|uniref:Serine protease n=1 Tax=Roseimicrobium gellanilyticum TaxID=748857 RepID=A0A366HBC9_9BACT|nr:serine protease [Roseimicrobium gellanilyticum]RBP39672.1 trypsin-like peptidase [Roseimicrobium gellanilyticum]